MELETFYRMFCLTTFTFFTITGIRKKLSGWNRDDDQDRAYRLEAGRDSGMIASPVSNFRRRVPTGIIRDADKGAAAQLARSGEKAERTWRWG